MRILMAVHAVLPGSLGGVEVYVRDLGAALSRLGHDVALVVPGDGLAREDVSRRTAGGVRIFEVHAGARDPRGWRDLRSRHPAVDAALASILRDVRPDLLLVHHLSGLSLALPEEARRMGIPVRFMLHDHWYACPRGQLLRADLSPGDPSDPAGCAACLGAELDDEEAGRPDLAVPLLEALAAGHAEVGPGGAPPSLVRYELAGESLPAVFAHPPLRVELDADVRPGMVLAFAAGLSPEVHREDRGEGVTFSVEVDGVEAWRETIDPKRRPGHRHWHHRSVPLPAGRRRLVLRTVPEGASNVFNWAAWGAPRLEVPRITRVAARAALYRAELALASQVRGPSRDILDRHAAWGVPRAAMVHADYGFDAARLAGFARAPGRGLRVGFLGTLIPSKGPHVLLEALRLADVPGVELHLWGRDVPYFGDASHAGRLRTAAAGLPVTFHEPTSPDGIADAFAAMDVLAVPSLWPENSPLTIHEAFMTGTPVVASATGGIPELVRDGENGLLVPPGDASALGAALGRLAADRELVRHLGRSTPVRSIEEDARDVSPRAR